MRFCKCATAAGGNCPRLNDTRTPNATPLIINLNIDGHPQTPIFSELPLFNVGRVNPLPRYIVKNRAYKPEVPYRPSTKVRAVSFNYVR